MALGEGCRSLPVIEGVLVFSTQGRHAGVGILRGVHPCALGREGGGRGGDDGKKGQGLCRGLQTCCHAAGLFQWDDFPFFFLC